MSIENLAPYSPTTVYGQLTSPFTPKTITINAHTPYDKVDESTDESKVYSRAYFEGKPQARNVYDGIYEYESYYPDDFPPKPSNINSNNNSFNSQDVQTTKKNSQELSSFSVSSYSDNQILKGALTQGYSVNESVVIQNAYNAYQRSALITKNAPEVLSTCSYRVF